MGALAPADGWTNSAGTWGTDLDRNESVFLSGNCSMELKSTAVAASVVSDYIPITAGVSGNAAYEISVTLRATRVDPADVVTVRGYVYSADKTLLGTATFWSGALSAANTWEIKTDDLPVVGTGQNYFRVEIAKAATAFSVYIDEVVFVRMAPGFRLLGNVTLPASGAFVDVTFTSKDEQYDVQWTNPSATVSLLYARQTVLIGHVDVSSGVPDGTRVSLRIVNGAGTTIATATQTVGAAASPLVMVAECVFPDGTASTRQFKLQAAQNSGVDKAASAIFSGMQHL